MTNLDLVDILPNEYGVDFDEIGDQLNVSTDKVDCEQFWGQFNYSLVKANKDDFKVI